MEFLTNIFSHSQGVVAVVLVLGGLIFFHELGHFLVARFFGVGVRTFALGFGPKLLTKRSGKTDYCLALIPFGGYVSMVGEHDDEDETAAKDDRVFEENEYFTAKAAWQRMLIVAAGPVANFILAWVIYFALSFSQGASYLLPIVGEVMPDSPAMSAGLEKDDIIFGMNNAKIKEWLDVNTAVQASKGGEIALNILRGNEEITLNIMPRRAETTNIFGEAQEVWQIGVKASGQVGHEEMGLFDAMISGVEQTWGMIAFTFESIVKLFQNVVPLDAVGGPIMIVQAVGEQASQGLSPVLLLAALISVNLGILNLLPIPVLDGGHIVFLTLEMILRRPVNDVIREYSMRVGVALLLGLMVFATWNDIVRLIS